MGGTAHTFRSNFAAVVVFACLVAMACTTRAASTAGRSAGPAGGAGAARPQGTIVFANDRSGTFQIYSIRADGSLLGQLTRGKRSDTAPLFSPDGRRIVFSRASKQNTSELWVMNADGSGQRNLAPSGYAPAWSPDSRRIAYIGGSGPLVLRSVNGGGRIVLRGRNLGPYWSPDGRLIAFSREVGDDRIDLMVIGADGRGLRTVRRKGVALGWSPRGEIAFRRDYYGTAVGLISANGRHARRLLASSPSALIWSPDGRRLAFVDRKGLHVASAAGRDVRSLPPKGANGVESSTWSPDSRWISVAFAPNGTTLRDLLLVAADGSSSRLLTARVPRPWGTGYGGPSWRPKGASPARLGGPPVAPLPSESVSASVFRPGTGTIRELAADGGLVAVVISAEPRICAGVEAWQPARRRFVRLTMEDCVEHGSLYEPAHGLAVAGTHVAWLDVDGGMTLETTVVAATLDRSTLVLADEGADEAGLGHVASEPMGHDGLLAFTVSHRCDEHAGGAPPGDCPPGRKTGDIVDATIWRLGGSTHCGDKYAPQRCTVVARADAQLTVLAVGAGRITARTGAGIRLLTAAGKVLRDFPVAATAAALSGNRLAIRTTDAVEIYDTGTGQRTDRFPVPKAVSLQDLEGDILVTASGETVTLHRLGDGRILTLHTDGRAKAKLEQPGLYLAGAHRVTFTQMKDVLRRLGG
jgi:Tol biopolymer transport system component